MSPPPNGLELPQAAATRARMAARIARFHLRVFDIPLDIPNVLSAHSFNGHYRHVWQPAALCIHRETCRWFHS